MLCSYLILLDIKVKSFISRDINTSSDMHPNIKNYIIMSYQNPYSQAYQQ